MSDLTKNRTANVLVWLALLAFFAHSFELLHSHSHCCERCARRSVDGKFGETDRFGEIDRFNEIDRFRALDRFDVEPNAERRIGAPPCDFADDCELTFASPNVSGDDRETGESSAREPLGVGPNERERLADAARARLWNADVAESSVESKPPLFLRLQTFLN